ncbi:M20/M25/M40 family metallo-hydrolase, partial [Candidatus Roizmanbacteria bacterium]|nr:M20/M25/M40 family metallo-hydrolase [Candidatus Roizmanbacteria bacterium]
MKDQNAISLLSDFIYIQSVSADSTRRGEILKAVEFLTKHLKQIGFDIKLIKKDQAPPLIIASLKSTILKRPYQDGQPTIGIYGHYDVQPEDPVQEWKSSPFKLTVRDGKIYGRGVADNKGHIIQNLTSIKHLIEVKKLANNIVFILEGEEEVGSENFEKYVKEEKDLLSKVDVFYITDVGMHNKNIPQILYGL